ncbi:MAG: guanylate kinase [Clostridia bacterium]|nr:guanylate kinase [Clostridia bacterium]
MEEKKGLVIVVSGPSGAGKSTVLEETFKKYPSLRYSVSVTTRKPRGGEVEGVNYNFKSVEEFNKMLANGEFLEYQEVYGNFYGTPVANVKDKLAEGYDVVLEIDVKGALNVKTKYPEAIMIFILPPSKKILAERLRARNTESEEQLNIRIASSIEEMKQAAFYDYVVINENANQAVTDVITIIEAEKSKVKNNKEFLDNLIYGGN